MMKKITLAFVCLVALTAMVHAQAKMSGTSQCAKPDTQHMIAIPDRPNHSFLISQSKCTWSKPFEIEGVQSKDDVVTVRSEASGNVVRDNGYVVLNMASGDKAFVRFSGSTTLKDGAPQSAKGDWSFTGGTGKLKGLKGKGTYDGTGNADGSVTYQVEGEYQMPAKK